MSMDIEKQLFSTALGISKPIFIEDIRFEESELHIYLNFYRGAEFSCPVCGCQHQAYDTEVKIWRHLNFFQYKSFLHFPTPRIDCPSCGIHRYSPEWTRPQSGFTLLFEAFIITLVRGGLPFSELKKLTGENDTRLRRIVDYYVDKSYMEKDFSGVTEVAVDETSSKKGHKYITVFINQEDKSVLFATTGKDSETIKRFADECPKHGLNPDEIKEISMDMSVPFQAGVANYLPEANITFDKFHVVKLLNDAVDKVRRSEQKLNPLLQKSRYVWLKNRENLTAKQLEKLQDLENENLQTAEAYRLKITFQDIYDNIQCAETAEFLLKSWIKHVLNSGLEPLIDFSKTLLRHFDGVIRYFKIHITNGISEGINSIIGQIKRRAKGYSNVRNFINMIYLIKGNLSLPSFSFA